MTTFRTFTNRPGVTYDEPKTDRLFAEDLNAFSKAIKDIEDFIYPKVAYVDYLIVAGGGAGGRTTSAYTQRGGGGGAGGLLSGIKNLILGTYAIVIGPGGTWNGSTVVTSGSDSTALDLTAKGGGKGGTTDGDVGTNGGSGGGAWYAGTPHSTGEAGQGNDGGKGTLSEKYGGGGGGGAGAVGGDGTPTTGGAGGAGVSSSISGTSKDYAGGGSADLFGAVGHNPGSTSHGGGVGDNRGGAYVGGAGTANTGGGGGSGGGAGGSGVVIIRYLTSAMTATGGTKTTDGDYTVHTFTSNGSFIITNIA